MRSPTSGQGEKARIALAFRCQVAPQIALIVAYTTHAGNYPHLGQRQSATIILALRVILWVIFEMFLQFRQARGQDFQLEILLVA